MKKSILFAVVGVLVFSGAALAKSPSVDDLLLEEGVYNVAGKPNVKLRVFVYHGRPEQMNAKPASPTPTIVCENASTADVNSSEEVVSGAGWRVPSVFKYKLNSGSAPASVGKINVPSIAGNSYQSWENSLTGSVDFVYDGETGATRAVNDGQNIVAWGRTSGTALAVSYAWYYPSTGELLEVDTIMNNKFQWAWSNPATWEPGKVCAYSGVYDAQNILTHELGHTVGLADEYTSEFANHTMFGYGSKTETKKNTLTVGDILGALSLFK